MIVYSYDMTYNDRVYVCVYHTDLCVYVYIENSRVSGFTPSLRSIGSGAPYSTARNVSSTGTVYSKSGPPYIKYRSSPKCIGTHLLQIKRATGHYGQVPLRRQRN